MPVPPVNIGRKPQKRQPPPPPVAPPPPSPRIQAVNAGFGQSAPPQPPEFTADLPDPPVVGLNAGPAAGRDISLPRPAPPAPQPPAEVILNTPAQTVKPDLAPGITPPPPITPFQPTAQEWADARSLVAEEKRRAENPESPVDRRVRETGEYLDYVNQQQPQKRHGVRGRILSGLESFIIEGGRPFRNQMPRSAQELAYGLGRGAGGAAYGAANTEYPSRVRIESKRAQAGQEYDAALKRQQEETQNRLRDAQADYAVGRGPREDRKIEIQSLINRAKLQFGYDKLDAQVGNQKALLELKRQGLINDDEYHDALIEESKSNRTEKTREFNVMNDRWQKKFDADQRQRDFDNRIKERRTTAYEKAVQSGGGSSEVKRATAAAEVDAYEENIAELQSDLYELEQTPESERGSDYGRGRASLQRQLRDQTLKAEKARAAAGQQTKASVTREQLKAIGDEAEVRRIATDNGKDPNAYVRLWKNIRGQK